jgi:hypothetical protein
MLDQRSAHRANLVPIRWSDVQRVFVADLQEHWLRSQALGLQCPVDVFEQLFFEHHGDDEFARLLRFVDWQTTTWEERQLSGVALRRVAVPRAYRHAVDEARWRTLHEGLQDERPVVIEHWHSVRTWMRAPILVAGDVTGTTLDNECLVGFTRLGNLLGLLDRADIPESGCHSLWLGTASRRP